MFFAPFLQQNLPLPPFVQQSTLDAPLKQQKGPDPPFLQCFDELICRVVVAGGGRVVSGSSCGKIKNTLGAIVLNKLLDFLNLILFLIIAKQVLM